MKIKYRNFDDGVHYFTLTESAKNLSLDFPFSENVSLDVKMDKSMHQILLEGNVSVPAELECDRCAITFKSILKNSFQIVYFFDRDNVAEEDNSTVYIPPEVDIIDITDDVREFSFLSIPMKILCDSDCKGLCAHCGVNFNTESCTCVEEKINPQWEVLLKLKDKLK